MDVSIIFVNYKTKVLTINAIKSVIEKTEGIEYEIFVVDNASHDGSIEEIELTFPNINIIKSSINGGFGYANNLAIRQARGKYILCLNTDTLLVNNAIKIMFDFMEKEEHKNIGVCGGYLINKDNVPCNAGGNLPSLANIFWKFGLRNLFKNYYIKHLCITIDSDKIAEIGNIGYITGADIFFRKSVLDLVGFFDETFFMYYEETDLCKRIKDAGYDIKFVENAKIKHLENQSIDNKLKHSKLVKTSEYLYLRKHYKNKIIIAKIMYILLYFIDWIFNKNTNSKELLKLTIKGEV